MIGVPATVQTWCEARLMWSLVEYSATCRSICAHHRNCIHRHRHIRSVYDNSVIRARPWTYLISLYYRSSLATLQPASPSWTLCTCCWVMQSTVCQGIWFWVYLPLGHGSGTFLFPKPCNDLTWPEISTFFLFLFPLVVSSLWTNNFYCKK